MADRTPGKIERAQLQMQALQACSTPAMQARASELATQRLRAREAPPPPKGQKRCSACLKAVPANEVCRCDQIDLCKTCARLVAPRPA
jgi:hypothetical protein